MKNIALIFLLVFSVACNNNTLEKPKNLIEEEKMIVIIYSISLLDAMKNQGIPSQAKYPTNTELLKSKFKIDSLTFAQNSKYYASDYKRYKRMYEEVKKRLEEETQKLNGGKPVTPKAEEGIVK
jgi:hypothetical protein